MTASELLPDLLERCTFDPPATPVVCAVSGGADSLALLALAARSELRVTAVHVDHGLRVGSAAEADVVRAAAERFEAAFEAVSVSVADGSDLEGRARSARLEALAGVAQGRPVLTGHTADDQAETLLINLIRGTGPTGIGGMRPGSTKPILGLRRSETHALCAELGFVPVTDPTNDDPRFIRNRVRHEVLPLLHNIAKRDVVPLFARTADHTRSALDELAAQAAALDAADTAALRAVSPELAAIAVREWLRTAAGHPPSTAELERVMAVVHHEVEATELSGGRRLARTKGRLRIEGAANGP